MDREGYQAFFENCGRDPTVKRLVDVFAAAAIDFYSLSVERGGAVEKGCWDATPGNLKQQEFISSQQAYRSSFEALCRACKERSISYPEDLDLVVLCEALRS